MSIIRILFAVLSLFFSSIGFALGAPPCLSLSECNDEGGKAYRKKDYLAAIALYEWQLRYAEMQKGEASQDEELALNNLLVTNLKNENLAKARAWMWVALDRGFGGKATRFNVERTIQAFDYRGMPGMQGHYERYAGMGEWETLDIEPNEQGVEMAIFSLMRIGNPNTLAQSGPAAIGDLGVRLAGTKDYRTAISEDLDVGCSIANT
ncbi:hypothetical protein ACNFH5_22115 [Pseudomonas sp. NY15435]|uniref:hypothetical protein n=1 Tax=Pseudomonas sp. NY15435 TaxID=3400358 RepID=UPI003A8AC5F6